MQKLLAFALASLLLSCAQTKLSDKHGSGNTLPCLDTLIALLPFPVNNVTAPAPFTTAELIRQINDAAAPKTLQLLDLCNARAYSFVPRGERSDSIERTWHRMTLQEMVDAVNNQSVRLKCNGLSYFNNALITALNPAVQSCTFSFGNDRQSHVVSLWNISGTWLYYDALNNITLAKPDGDTIDFRHAFTLICAGDYEQVQVRELPEYFGPDWSMLSASDILNRVKDIPPSNIDAVWRSWRFGTPVDSAFFCTRDSAYALGMYGGNTWQSWLSSSHSPASGQAVLDTIAARGFERNIFNWWRINPNCSDASVQTFVEKFGPR